MGWAGGPIEADAAHPGHFAPRAPGAHKAFKFRKYATQYLGAFAYRFNGRFNLKNLLLGLLGHAATASPIRERQIRGKAEVHD